MSKTIRFSDLREGAAPSGRAARGVLRTVRRAAAEGNRAFAASMVRRGVPAGHGTRADAVKEAWATHREARVLQAVASAEVVI